MTGPAPPASPRREAFRLVALAVAAAWLLHPFATGRMVGAGDALFYKNALADSVSQLRAGVFPIYVGQTEFEFNGAVAVLRVVPLYAHLADVLDLLTRHHLGFFALQHLCVIVCGVAAIFACYFALCAISPRHRWSSVALAILYLSCPGVLGTIYTEDLYKTWMAVPFAPLAAYGIVRSFRSDTIASQVWLAAPLAALWWAHSPIALWMTFVEAGSQVVRLAAVHRRPGAWKRASLGGLFFILLAQYPFVSVAAIHSPGAGPGVFTELGHPEKITEVIREVFPAILLPLSRHAGALSDLQLGYGLWAVFFCALLAAGLAARWELGSLLAGCALLFVFLLPVPGVTVPLWNHLPETIKRITFYWPMQRFYIILASLLAFSGRIAFDLWADRGQRIRTVLGALLCLACAWSLWESRQFILAGYDRTAPEELSERNQRPENEFLTIYSYSLFPRVPAYFSAGVMDPASETRLLDRQTLQPLAAPSFPVVASGSFEARADANPGVAVLDPPLRLEFGHRYELEFSFAHKDYHGILQLQGKTFFREYVLPSSGRSLAFGSRPPNSPVLPLWTTAPGGDNVTLRFIPASPGATAADYRHFATFRLHEVDPRRALVTLASLLPFQAAVHAPAPAWIETPRMFMPGYRATEDGRQTEVRRSPNGLVMIPVGAGAHAVELRFVAPAYLGFSYGSALAAWAVLFVVVVGKKVRLWTLDVLPAMLPSRARPRHKRL